MKSASGILSFLAECYRENGSRVGITSLASGRVRRSLIVEGEDAVVSRAVLEGLLFIPGKEAALLATQARLYEKECELFYGSVFLTGNLETGETQKKPPFAPLILYSTAVERISEGAGAEFSIDIGRRILNYALLDCLGDDNFIARIEQCVDESAHTEGCVGEIRRLFEEVFPNTDTTGLLSFPHLLSAEELGRAVLKHSSLSLATDRSFSLLPAAVLFLADRSTEMRGVLNDLNAMAETPARLSDPVRILLGQPLSEYTSRDKLGRGEIPGVLSAAQEQIAASARVNPLTLAVGPPGTGKSFTIATLAMEAMSRGESVLIASKMDHAVDVVADKIERTLGLPGICVRAGRKSYLKDLKTFLEDLLSGLLTSEPVTSALVTAVRENLRRGRRTIERAEREFEKQGRREEKRGLVLSTARPGVFTRWRIARLQRVAVAQGNVNRFSLELANQVIRQIGNTVEYLKLNRSFLLKEALRRHRKTFQAFSKGVRARTAQHQETYFEDVRWESLLEALPVWLVNLSDLHRVVPLESGLFDLVIIDEASQCDIASAMPALQRGKRAVITGDPKQLRHLSFLQNARQEEFARRFGLSDEEQARFHFRKVSLVDLVAEGIRNQDAVVFLNEHFRSRPAIIGFSNREFYASRLAIMTGHREADHRAEPPLSVFKTGGHRGANGVNEVELGVILAQLQSITRPDAPPLSIGILSPFRAQVDAILKEVEKLPVVTRLLDKHALLVGTAHSFQGEERDIMFLSLVLDDESPSASFRFLEKADLFNVSITRARLENRIFVSFDSARTPHRLIDRFLDYATKSESFEGSGPERVKSASESCWTDVRTALEARGYEILEDFVIGGYILDLLCRGNGKSLGIDLIGFPGPHSEAMSLDRHLMMQRAGILLFPISRLEWETKRERVLRELEGCISG
ncbi:MAG: hypothetical protein KA152_08485 [Verrucomicrobiales bacterium]|nr:hypothetical protein [Verrucomicrobiales bacterium]